MHVHTLFSNILYIYVSPISFYSPAKLFFCFLESRFGLCFWFFFFVFLSFRCCELYFLFYFEILSGCCLTILVAMSLMFCLISPSCLSLLLCCCVLLALLFSVIWFLFCPASFWFPVTLFVSLVFGLCFQLSCPGIAICLFDIVDYCCFPDSPPHHPNNLLHLVYFVFCIQETWILISSYTE